MSDEVTVEGVDLELEVDSEPEEEEAEPTFRDAVAEAPETSSGHVTVRPSRSSSASAEILQLRSQLEAMTDRLREVGIEPPVVPKPADFLVEPPSTRTHNDLVSEARRKSVGKTRKSARFAADQEDTDDDSVVPQVQTVHANEPIIDGRELTIKAELAPSQLHLDLA